MHKYLKRRIERRREKVPKLDAIIFSPTTVFCQRNKKRIESMEEKTIKTLKIEDIIFLP